jgi:hypothetical protein
MAKSKLSYLQCVKTGAVFSTYSPDNWTDTIKTNKASYIEYQLKTLKEKLIKNAVKEVYTMRLISKSGMTHKIKLFCIIDNQLQDITLSASNACDMQAKGGFIIWRGCGSDMAHDAVYDLAYCTSLELNQRDLMTYCI